MNQKRRAKISDVISRLEELSDKVDMLRDEEQDYYDNIPENLQGSERADASESAIDALESAVDSITEAISSLEEAAG